jgi:hypothetical protein
MGHWLKSGKCWVNLVHIIWFIHCAKTVLITDAALSADIEWDYMATYICILFILKIHYSYTVQQKEVIVDKHNIMHYNSDVSVAKTCKRKTEWGSVFP